MHFSESVIEILLFNSVDRAIKGLWPIIAGAFLELLNAQMCAMKGVCCMRIEKYEDNFTSFNFICFHIVGFLLFFVLIA